MESLENYIGTTVYVNGKPYGRAIDFYIDTEKKKITGLVGISAVGFFRQRFWLPRHGITAFSENGIVADKHYIKAKKLFNEEAGQFACSRQSKMIASTVGNIYFEPKSLKLVSVSVKKGLIDDLLFGRDIVDIDNVYFTPKGKITEISED